MPENLSVFLAFGAGLLSFFSPCVLPLIPSYLGILGGAKPEKDDGGRFRFGLILAALAFIAGFSAVFIFMSLFFSTALAFAGPAARYLNLAAGVVVIILGFNVIFDFIPFLNYEKRFHPAGGAGAFLGGAAFAAGWTPCTGPILAGILLLAGQNGKAGTAALYLAFYSAGLGVPFLLAAVFLDRFLARAAKLRPHLPLIRRISGIMLIVIGVMILTGRYTALNILVQQAQYRYILWAEDRALPFRLLARWLSWLQRL